MMATLTTTSRQKTTTAAVTSETPAAMGTVADFSTLTTQTLTNNNMTASATMTDTYNGWANYETWNASLWIQNDRFLYNTAKACVEFCETTDTPYEAFIRCMDNCARTMTGDDVAWNDPTISHDEMNDMMYELASGW